MADDDIQTQARALKKLGFPIRATISGMGVGLPAKRITSRELDQRHGWAEGTLERVCGVRERTHVSGEETQESLGVSAALGALQEAGVGFGELDLLLFAAAVGRQPIPATAPLIKRELQRALQAQPAAFPAFDVNATCLGALVAMDQAAQAIALGRARHVLVVTSEIASRALPWETHPATAGLFGDGAAAIVMSAVDGGQTGPGFGPFRMETYEEGYDICALGAGGTRFDYHSQPLEFQAHSLFAMDGPALYRLSAREFPGFLDRLLAEAGLTQAQIDLVVPHQASPHALAHLSRRCGFSPGRVWDRVAVMGNQVAASLPLALQSAREEGALQPGMNVLMLGTSAGVSFGGAVLRT
jgi:3-oxoacyl-[acyl-carrier-protein] synthase-3